MTTNPQNLTYSGNPNNPFGSGSPFVTPSDPTTGGIQPPNPPNAPAIQPVATTQNPTTNSSTSNPPQGSQDISANPAPNLLDLYQQELKNRGIDTANQQLLDTSNQILGDQQVVAPLQNSNFIFPKSEQQLQDVGLTQDQLNLKSAQAAAPIQTALSFLIQSRSALSTYITNQSALAKQSVDVAQQEYENKLKLASYDFTQIGSHVNELGQTVPDYGYINAVTGKIVPATNPNTDNLSNQSYNAGGFGATIGTRPSPSNPNVTEYYNTQTGKGFSNPQELADFYNKQTGTNKATAQNIFSLVGQPQGGSGIPGSNPRTDRNNNPIASSVAVNPDGTPNMNDPTTAEWVNALNQTNIPYTIEQGSNFGNRATISFGSVQNGIDGAITLLGTSAFNWYKNNTGKQELQGVNTPQDFNKLSYDQKVSIVKGIYSHEQPGGSLFNVASSSASATNNTTIQKQIASLSPIQQKFVSTSPSGYAYTNANAPDNFRLAIGSKGADIIPLSPDQALKENSLVTGMGLIQNAQKLVEGLNLPTDPYDPERLVNTWNAKLANDPQLAQLQQYWQGAVQTLQGLGVSGLRSTMLIDKAALTDFPNATSIDSVAKAQLEGILNIVQTEERVLMGRPPAVDYSSQAQNLLQGSVTNGQNTTYDTLNQLWGGLQVVQAQSQPSLTVQ